MALKTIVIKGAGIRKEAIADAAIKPGSFLERTTTGVKVRVATTAIPVLVAVENEVVGKDIDTDYATSDTVLFGSYGTGVEINAIITDGQVITVGEALQIGAAGKLITLGAGAIVAIALEAVSPSGSDLRCVVELV